MADQIFRRRARAQQVDTFNNVVLNIGITGETGAGKSSFVNAIRGPRVNEVRAAKTGVTQTTMYPTAYYDPSKPNIIIWDLPGIGDNTFKASTYLKDVKFKKYDFFIIVSAGRFKENDIMLAKEIQKKKKKFYFVRSKIDLDVKHGKEKGVTEEHILQTIREDCEKNLRKIESSAPVFLVASRDWNRFDFQELVEALERDLPGYKRPALVLNVQ
ncbi:interferon-gamma-inducible GTPase 10-like [Sardina pilchardus]|uniref:interferon-gamma-inducible GTPase 10-like n=1 Tax=Sardina pilchardus TaxID=27697 RepID=UPI002E15B951